MMMGRVTVIYHWEPEGCWAECPDAPGFSAAADTFSELREKAREGLAFYFDQPVDVFDIFPDIEPAWTATSASEVVSASSTLWRTLVTQGTKAAGALTTRSLILPAGHFTVRSTVARAG